MSNAVKMEDQPIPTQAQPDGTSFDDIEFLDAVAVLRYDLTPQWDIGLGVQSYSRKLNVAELQNRYDGSSVFLTVGYSF